MAECKCALRNTNQRVKILGCLCAKKFHPTAEEVYRNVKKDMPAISLATVYRNLELLVKEGKAIKFEVNGITHFDADICCHQHFVCRSCGRIIDICQKEISKYAMEKVAKDEFAPDAVKIIFWGNCRKCKKNG